jgi:hypothetical protein
MGRNEAAIVAHHPDPDHRSDTAFSEFGAGRGLIWGLAGGDQCRAWNNRRVERTRVMFFKKGPKQVNEADLDPIAQELIPHPGVSYIEYMAEVVHTKGSKRYLEIGTNFGSSLAPITCSSIAIDPTFRLTMEVVGTKKTCLMYQMTSDDFFAEHDPKALLGGPLDVAFLDGMHLYEFLVRDFYNTEKSCSRESLIILHDCLPGTFEMTNRQFKPAMLNVRYQNYWTGDVWKVMPILAKYRPDLRVVYVDCPPTGLAIISNCDPKSTVLETNYKAIVEEFKESDRDMDMLKQFLSGVTNLSSREYTGKLIEAKLWA